MKLFAGFDEYQNFRALKTDGDDTETETEAAAGADQTPLEAIELGYHALRAALAADLLGRVKSSSPEFFERLVVELLLEMGYGGSRRDAGRALGRSGDGGVDGIIKEDRLGLETIHLQAKRWTDKAVGRPDVQQFQGALAGHGATRGIFLTTSTFSKEALAHADGLRSSRIVLVDGKALVEFMLDHEIGVSTSASSTVQRMDSDYFAEGEE